MTAANVKLQKSRQEVLLLIVVLNKVSDPSLSYIVYTVINTFRRKAKNAEIRYHRLREGAKGVAPIISQRRGRDNFGPPTIKDKCLDRYPPFLCNLRTDVSAYKQKV